MKIMYPGMPNSPTTELAAAITATQTTITVLNGSALPDAPNLAVIGGEGELAETILYTNKSGNTLSGITRGLQGVARAWESGLGIARNFTDVDYAALVANITNHDEQLTGATATPTANRIAMYDVNGRLKSGAAPSASSDVLRKVELDVVNTQMDTLNTEMANVKQSGSEFKRDVAGAITAKGVPTAPDADKQTFVGNINSIVTDPSGDATATAADLLSGKTAYSKKQKITGTMPNRIGTQQATSAQVVGDKLQIKVPNGYYGDSSMVERDVEVVDIEPNELWSRSDIGGSHSVYADAQGNVYCAHSAYMDITIRKFNKNGNEIWSKSDVDYGNGVYADAQGFVYCAHGVDANRKSIRKLNSGGAEIWSKTDVPLGQSVYADAQGNVYCAHRLDIGRKSIRKLNSGGVEIWSKTDVPIGQSIYADAQGNVYCAHGTSSGKFIRKLDSNGNEIWSKTDVPSGGGVYADAQGFVYCAHDIAENYKSIRKLNSSGVEIWSKIDVPYARSVYADTQGNVYCAHAVVSDQKSIRKLNSGGAEIWSKKDVRFGQSIYADAQGFVYCAHGANSGKPIRKLQRPLFALK
ncbi:hypothetical protein ACFSTH_08420 [Paenibacillus yanchengensis]|uniref:Uncharacterized protein n=1 Tax=Paenibacillus yanchengensis TaxID=2035833 RepID=A0ABW4YLD1_9BACL